MKRACYLGLCFFDAGFLPYAVSRDYVPTYHDVMSRTCLIGAFAGALWFAALIEYLRPEPAIGVSIYLAIGLLFSAADIRTGYWWATSWKMQQQVLADFKANAQPEKSGNVYYRGPLYLDADMNPVIVFSATWDFDSAIRLALDRPDIHGFVGAP